MSKSRQEIAKLVEDMTKHLYLDDERPSESEQQDLEGLALELHLDGYRKVVPAESIEALLKLADDMENAIHGGPESIARNGRRFNASERIRRIVGVAHD